MLNKLLKRCMPWMNKGRWYHVRITTDQDNNTSVIHDNIFSRYTVVGGTNKFVHLYFADTEPKKTIIDYKVIAHSLTGQYVNSGIYFPLDVVYDEVYYIEINIIPSTMYDYWIFIEG